MENRSMMVLSAITALHYVFSIPLALVCLFLTLLILVQRGRGGGLTGALGGMGGQSAFGTKAGDVFTRITIIVAAVWILLSMAAIKVLTDQAEAGPLNRNQRSAPLNAGKDATKADAENADKNGAGATGGLTPEKTDNDDGKAVSPPPTAGPSLPPEPAKAAEKEDAAK
jgi:preprotein translocase subunit SecG